MRCWTTVLDYRVGLPPQFQCLVMSCECICIKCLKPTLEQGQKFIKMSFGRLFSAVNARSLVLIRLNRLEIRRLLSRRLWGSSGSHCLRWSHAWSPRNLRCIAGSHSSGVELFPSFSHWLQLKNIEKLTHKTPPHNITTPRNKIASPGSFLQSFYWNGS